MGAARRVCCLELLEARLSFTDQQGGCSLQLASGALGVGEDKGMVCLELSVPRSSSLENPRCICVSSLFKDVFRLLFPKIISNSVSYLEKQMEKARLNLILLVEPSHFQLY